MRVQVLGTSKLDPHVFIVMSGGVVREFTFMKDTDPSVLRALKRATKKREAVDVDACDLEKIRTIDPKRVGP